ncbi:4'-phosphopantetheinyl transferase family protein [Streptomyces roseolus]|uniref:4'-phosphopantetheinyl transferase family protein n=1 Tax=Streptomyces roseolus TaxID=67358 RepID=UPI001E394C1F|nr:4'-phosphopantetheinyl transferase superfamily protein [Streptomyces roseolus]
MLDVWLLPPPESPRDVPGHELDAVERRRAESFLQPADRRMYLAAHVGLRRVLALYTGIAPARLVIAGELHKGDGGRHGRPRVLRVPGAPQFSLSHSHGLALAAVAHARVGADVQRIPSDTTVEACLPALHPDEREELLAVPAHARAAVFGRLWTRKEAYLKGLGTGLNRAPSLDYLGEGEPAGRPPGWLVGNLPLCEGHVGAVALRGSGTWQVAMRAVPAAYLYAADAGSAVRGLGGIEPGFRTVLRDRSAEPRGG